MKENDLTDILEEPEYYYPINFKTAKKANAIYSTLCQEAATEIKKLRCHIEMLEKKLYLAKVQESLMRPIVDEYGKAS